MALTNFKVYGRGELVFVHSTGMPSMSRSMPYVHLSSKQYLSYTDISSNIRAILGFIDLAVVKISIKGYDFDRTN